MSAPRKNPAAPGAARTAPNRDAAQCGRIKNDLLARVRRGGLRGRLPGEAKLAGEYGVARAAMRAALEALEADGHVQRDRSGRFRAADVRGAGLQTVHFVLHHSYSGSPQTPLYNYPVVQDLLAGAAHEARQRGLGFNVLSADYYSREPAAALKGLGPGDGLVITGVCELVDVALTLGLPVVNLYLLSTEAPSLNCVVYDRAAAVAMGMRHLMECGVRDVAYVLGEPPDSPGWRMKVAEARRVAGSFGAPLPPERVIDASPYAEIAGEQVREYLRTHKPPEAFFCGTDHVAAAILTVVQCLGMVVPDDIMLVGYGDYAVAARTLPPLTTVRVPRFQIGARAVDTLGRVMSAEPGAAPVRETLQPELVIRETTRPPHRPRARRG